MNKQYRLSQLQRRALAWLAEDAAQTAKFWAAIETRFGRRLPRPSTGSRYRQLVKALGTTSASSNISVSLSNLETKGLIRIRRSTGGYGKMVFLTQAGEELARQCGLSLKA